MSSLFSVRMSFGAVADRHRGPALRRVQRGDQGAAGVLELGQDARALLRAVLDLGGIGPAERRRAGHHLAVDHGVVQRHVMPFHPPAPGAFVSGRAEHREPIEFRIPRLCPALFDLAQHGLQLDDGGVGLVAARTEPGLQNVVGSGTLRLGHVLDQQTIARKILGGDEVQRSRSGGLEGERGALPLLGRQRRQELAGGSLHRRCRPLRLGRDARRPQRPEARLRQPLSEISVLSSRASYFALALPLAFSLQAVSPTSSLPYGHNQPNTPPVARAKTVRRT